MLNQISPTDIISIFLKTFRHLLGNGSNTGGNMSHENVLMMMRMTSMAITQMVSLSRVIMTIMVMSIKNHAAISMMISCDDGDY
jgi:hypothetical protein